MCEDQGTGFVRERYYNELPEGERPEGLTFEYAVTLSDSGETWFYLLTEAQWASLTEVPGGRGGLGGLASGIEACPVGEVVHFVCLKKLVEFIQAEGIVLKDYFAGALY